MDSARAKAIGAALLAWYFENKRDLPWRTDTQPYPIWISEIMAQQTRITALLPYYRRFLSRFPDVQTLAAADETEVLKAWEGLGYYSRARNLHRAAQIVVRDHNGQLPDTEKGLLSLPGIGEYTAAAILSIAFCRMIPAVDGNVFRVHSRLALDETEISLPAAKKSAKAFALACMPPEHPGHFTQALMELGALVCTPKSPLCGECPLSSLCLAFGQGRQAELPVKAEKKSKEERDITVLFITDHAGRIAMRRRSESLLHGMWEFMTVEGTLNEGEIITRLTELGIPPHSVQPAGTKTHVFTHKIWHMRGYRCMVDSLTPLREYELIPLHEVPTLALPTAFQHFWKEFSKTVAVEREEG